MACDNSFYTRSGVIPLAFYRMLRNEGVYRNTTMPLENRPTSCADQPIPAIGSAVTESHPRQHRR